MTTLERSAEIVAQTKERRKKELQELRKRAMEESLETMNYLLLLCLPAEYLPPRSDKKQEL
jgi:hypothetical protein